MYRSFGQQLQPPSLDCYSGYVVGLASLVQCVGFISSTAIRTASLGIPTCDNASNLPLLLQTQPLTNTRLSQSRSHRLVWLFELLGLDYELKIYLRNKEYRAPKELEQVHPLGKSPVVEVIKADGTKLVLAETGHIIQYVVSHFDTHKKLVPTSETDQVLVDYFLHFTEGTLQPQFVALLVLSMAKTKSPFFVSPLVGAISNAVSLAYYRPELLKSLTYLENHLKNKTGAYFVGDKLTGADVILSFPIGENLFGDASRASQIAGGDVAAKFPNLKKWADLIKEDPALQKANSVVHEKDPSAKL